MIHFILQFRKYYYDSEYIYRISFFQLFFLSVVLHMSQMIEGFKIYYL